jgi:hypothetical protein
MDWLIWHKFDNSITTWTVYAPPVVFDQTWSSIELTFQFLFLSFFFSGECKLSSKLNTKIVLLLRDQWLYYSMFWSISNKIIFALKIWKLPQFFVPIHLLLMKVSSLCFRFWRSRRWRRRKINHVYFVFSVYTLVFFSIIIISRESMLFSSSRFRGHSSDIGSRGKGRTNGSLFEITASEREI